MLLQRDMLYLRLAHEAGLCRRKHCEINANMLSLFIMRGFNTSQELKVLVSTIYISPKSNSEVKIELPLITKWP